MTWMRNVGVAKTAELLARGETQGTIRAAVAARSIIRVRKGWYAHPTVTEPELRAWRVGGRLTAASALRARGVWAPRDALLHVAVVRTASRLRTPDDFRSRRSSTAVGDVEVYWTDRRGPGTRTVVAIAPAIEDLLRCHPLEVAQASAESALRLGLLTRRQWRRTLRRLHLQFSELESGFDSGWETVARIRLRRRGFVVVVHPWIDGVGEGDLLVGALLVEIDGAAFHSGDHVHRDRQRDARAALQGIRTLRFSARQVEFEWPLVEAAIAACPESRRPTPSLRARPTPWRPATA